MNNLSKRRLAVIEATAKAYTLSTRCVINENGGSYRYNIDGHQGCAVGRLVGKKLRKELPEGKTVGNILVFDLLPKRIQSLGVEFLKDLQRLHDDESNWTNEGLSCQGERKVEHMKIDHNLLG